MKSVLIILLVISVIILGIGFSASQKELVTAKKSAAFYEKRSDDLQRELARVNRDCAGKERILNEIEQNIEELESRIQLKGKSAYLFMKAFMLTDKGAETFEITKTNEIPSGYEVADVKNAFEEKLWKKFWEYALDPKKAGKVGIKNAQIEAPGTKFIPGIIYSIKIEHDGGLRIDSKPVNSILKNEKIKF